MKKDLISFVKSDAVMRRFQEVLGPKKAPKFASALVQLVAQKERLKNCEPVTVLQAALTSATLDLPIQPQLGYAHIVPYGDKAQFQIGWKGLVQLALRTGQYIRLGAVKIHENQFRSWNPLTEELDADMSQRGTGKVVGYAAYFKLRNGFEKVAFMYYDEAKDHAARYSKSYKSGRGSVWLDGETGFDAMALKTVLKLTLSKWGILSEELQTAVVADQSVQEKLGEYQYIDNPRTGDDLDHDKVEVEKTRERIAKHIEQANDLTTLSEVAGLVEAYELAEQYEAKFSSLADKKQKK